MFYIYIIPRERARVLIIIIIIPLKPKCCFAIVLYYTTAVNSWRSKSPFTPIHSARNYNTRAFTPGVHSSRRIVCSFERGDSAEEVSHQCQPQQWASGWSINLRLAAPERARSLIGVEPPPNSDSGGDKNLFFISEATKLLRRQAAY